METPCAECNRLRGRINEAIDVSERGVRIWNEIHPPDSDNLLGVMIMNTSAQRVALEAYIRHLGAFHRRFPVAYTPL